MISVAINGFGRIGRNFLRALLLDQEAQTKVRIVAINGGDAEISTMAHMFTYDTVMGTFRGDVRVEGNELIINKHRITLIAERDVQKISWKQYGAQWIVESSGHFTKRADAEKHIQAGAHAVLITAPAHDEDMTIVMGVNEEQFNNAAQHRIVSLGSCTTNALVPLLKLMHDAFTVEQAFMTTIHAYTNTQILLDKEDTDLRRARAAALNIIPTSTGASDMVEKLLPELSGRVFGVSVRVPVAKVSLIDCVFRVQKAVSADLIHEACKIAAAHRMRGIMQLSDEPLVSSDYSGNPYSVVIDAELTQAQGTMCKIFGWYDNEWAYSVRLKDFLCHVAGK